MFAVEPAGDAQVLGDAQRREHALAAGHHGDAELGDLVRRGVGDVTALEDDGAGVGLDHAGDGLQQGRLAGAVGAEQRHDLALVDLDVDVEEDLDVAVAHVELADQQLLERPLPGLVEELAAGGHRRPHVGDVLLEQLARRGDDHAPRTKIGVMINMPTRMPNVSPSAPMIGSMNRPG
ncbi:MAG: hypothetical protein R2690_18110 [Acidimicrobiales bacterium]